MKCRERRNLNSLIAPRIVDLNTRCRRHDKIRTEIDAIHCIAGPFQMLSFLPIIHKEHDHTTSRRSDEIVKQTLPIIR